MGEDGKGRASKSVTLLVKNPDAPRLHLAQTRGKLTLALRSGDDNQIAEAQSATESELLGIFAEKPAESQKPAEPRKPSFSQGRDITVVHGSHTRIHQFRGQSGKVTTMRGVMMDHGSDNDDMDQTWVSNYLAFMGIDPLLPPAADAPESFLTARLYLSSAPNPATSNLQLSFELPRPRVGDSLDFSFSGLKTALVRLTEGEGGAVADLVPPSRRRWRRP